MFDRTVGILEEFVDGDIEITKDSALVDDLGLSSLDVIRMVAAFEDEFDIDVPDRIIPSLRTVGDIDTLAVFTKLSLLHQNDREEERVDHIYTADAYQC